MDQSTKGLPESMGATKVLRVFTAWMIRVLLGALLFLVLVVAMILLVQPRLDLTPYREPIAHYLSGAVGRDVRLGGDLQLGLGRHVHFSASELSVANPAWAESEELFRIAEASAGLDLFGLLSGVIHLQDVVLRDAAAFLELSADGRRSWDLGAADAQDEVAEQRGSAWRLVIGDARAENVSLIYRDPAAARPLQVDIADWDQNHDAGMLVLDASAMVNELPLSLQGRIGPLESLIAGRNIDADLRAELDETVANIRGRFGDPQRLEDIEMEATVRGPSLADLLSALGIRYDQGGDIDLSFRVIDRERGLAWESSGHLGAIALDTQGEVARPLELNDLRLTLRAEGSDLSVVGRILGVPGLPEHAYRVQGDIERNENGLELRDVQLVTGESKLTLSGRLPRFPRFEQASTRLEIVMPKPAPFAGLIGSRLAGLGPLRAKASLVPQGEGLAVLDAAVDWGKNRLALNGPLGDYPDFHSTRIGFEASGPSLAALRAATGMPGLPDGAYRLAGRLTVDDAARLRLDLDEGIAGDLRLAARGFLGKFPQLGDADLSLSLRGPSLRDVMGGTFLPAQAFEMKTRLFGELRAPNIDTASVSVGGAKVEMTGKIATGPMMAGTDAQFSAQVPRLADWVPAGKDSAWGRDSYRLAGRVVSAKGLLRFDEVKIESESSQLKLGAKLRRTDKGFVVSDLRAQLPEGEISAELSVEQRDRPYIDLVATARGFDLGRFLAADEGQEAPPPDAAPEQRVIPDTPLSLGFLDAIDGRFRISGEALSYPDPAFQDKVLVRDLHLDANLGRNGLALERLRLSGDRGTVEINGKLAPAAQRVTVEGTLKASEFRIGTLARGKALEQLPQHELDLKLAARGRTYRELAASLNGSALLTGGSGRVANAGIDAAFGSFLGEVFAAINPAKKEEPFTQVVCTAAALRVSDGIVQLAPGFIIRTDKLDIAAAGAIDLNTERIDVQFRNTPRKGTGLSLGGLVHRFVKVGGSLAKPDLALDSGGALLSGGAAAATGGLSLIVQSLFDRMSSAAVDPCAAIVAGASAGAIKSPRGELLDALGRKIKDVPSAVIRPHPKADSPVTE